MLHLWFQTFIYLFHIFPTFTNIILLYPPHTKPRLTFLTSFLVCEEWPSIWVFPAARSGGPSVIWPTWVCAAEQGIVLSILSLKPGIVAISLFSVLKKGVFSRQNLSLQKGIWLAVSVRVYLQPFQKKSNSTMTVISKMPLDNAFKSCVRNNVNQAHRKSPLFKKFGRVSHWRPRRRAPNKLHLSSLRFFLQGCTIWAGNYWTRSSFFWANRKTRTIYI